MAAGRQERHAEKRSEKEYKQLRRGDSAENTHQHQRHHNQIRLSPTETGTKSAAPGLDITYNTDTSAPQQTNQSMVQYSICLLKQTDIHTNIIRL